MAELTNTMKGGTLPPPSQGDPIEAAYKRLNDMLSGIQDVDIQAKFQPLIEEAQARPVSKPPGTFQTFAAAFGAPETTKQFLANKLEQISKEKEAKQNEISSLKEASLKGALQQELEKANFKKSLVHAEALERLHGEQAKQKRLEALEDYEKKTKILFGEKKGLAEEQAKNAKNLIRLRISETAKNFNFDEKLTLQLHKLAGQAALTQLQGYIAQLQVPPEDAVAMTQQLITSIAESLRTQQHEREGTAPPAPKDEREQRIQAIRDAAKKRRMAGAKK